MPIVAIERGNDKGKTVKVAPGNRYVFGRDPGASGLILNDSLCSRRHFQIVVEGATCRIEDLESTNGTYLNDERITAADLKMGDKIQVGETILSFLTDQKEETAQGLIGKKLGGYKILERVGRGGMGTVYRANQLSLNRVVALKVLSARLLKDEKFIEKFKSEARAAGQLNHPNIVQVYDVGSDRSLHFFSMEFMGGGSLQDKVGKDGKLTWEEGLAVFQQATQALIFAEKNGIVHRDVKPDNLMLTTDGQAKLADLGLARRTGDVEAEESIFGTPHFISPEQAQGQPVDHRADLYSLGATMYRLLAGRTPFRGGNVYDLIQQQITATPPPLRGFCSDAPDELIAVIERLMKKKPEERYPSAQELFDDLEAIRLEYHLGVTRGGGKGVLIAVVAAILAVAGVIIFALTRPPPPNPNGGGGTTIIVAGSTEPEIIVKTDPNAPEMKAEIAYGRVEREELRLGTLEKTWSTRKARWLAAAEAYEKVAKEHAGTKFARKAAVRAKTIRDTIARLDAAQRAAFGEAQKTWQSLRANVTKFLEEKRFGEALDHLVQEAAKEGVRKAAALLPEAAQRMQTWLKGPGTEVSIQSLFAAAFKNAKSEASRFADQGRYAEAAKTLQSFMDLSAKDGSGPAFEKAATEWGAIVDHLREVYGTALDQAVESDRALYYAAYRGIRHHAGLEGMPENPVFDFDFDAAADRMQKLLAEDGEAALTTTLYRERAKRKVAQLRSVAGLFRTLAEHFCSGDLTSTEIDLPKEIVDSNGARQEIDTDQDPVATADSLKIRWSLRKAGVTVDVPRTVSYRDFMPAELVELVFLHGSRFAMTPADWAAYARMLAELGLAKGLPEAIEAAGDALPASERSRLENEYRAISNWLSVIGSMDKRPPSEWELAASAFVQKYSSTDYFVLVYGHDAPGQQLLFPADAIQVWKDALLAELPGPK